MFSGQAEQNRGLKLMKTIKKNVLALTMMAAMTGVIATPFAAGMTKEVSTSKMPAVATPNSTNPNAPVDGSNSFTQAQVTERLGKAGFSNIKDLVKGDDGIWRAHADKKGMTHTVMFDYQGNITTGTSSTMPLK
jgi:ABC-type oligopeptide transport system substrate-binding subunit